MCCHNDFHNSLRCSLHVTRLERKWDVCDGRDSGTNPNPLWKLCKSFTWLFFSTVIGWYCVSRIGWKRTTNLRSYRMGLLQIMLLGFTIICLYEVLWTFTILNAEITSQMILNGQTPDIDSLAVEYPDILRPWNLIFGTKMWLAAALISGHAFYLSTKPRKSLEELES